MSEPKPIKWKPWRWGAHDASVEGVRVVVYPEGTPPIVVCRYEPKAFVRVDIGEGDRDLAARAVVAAVKVLRGEA